MWTEGRSTKDSANFIPGSYSSDIPRDSVESTDGRNQGISDTKMEDSQKKRQGTSSGHPISSLDGQAQDSAEGTTLFEKPSEEFRTKSRKERQ